MDAQTIDERIASGELCSICEKPLRDDQASGPDDRDGYAEGYVHDDCIIDWYGDEEEEDDD